MIKISKGKLETKLSGTILKNVIWRKPEIPQS